MHASIHTWVILATVQTYRGRLSDMDFNDSPQCGMGHVKWRQKREGTESDVKTQGV